MRKTTKTNKNEKKKCKNEKIEKKTKGHGAENKNKSNLEINSDLIFYLFSLYV